MKFSIVITGSPWSSQAPWSALRFTQAALEQGHSVHRVFFHGDGVLCASKLSVTPQDETNINHQWQQLGEEHQLDMVACIASALKRGIIDDKEAQRYELANTSLADSFQLSGLGQLVDASIHSDRVVTFGA